MDRCAEHETDLVDGECLVCTAERVLQGAALVRATMWYGFYCEHETVLDLGPSVATSGVLCKLRQCTDCGQLGFVDDDGKTIWERTKG